MFNKKLLNQLMKAAYGLGVVFLLAGMLLSAVAMPARAQEETPPAEPAEEPIDLTFEGPGAALSKPPQDDGEDDDGCNHCPDGSLGITCWKVEPAPWTYTVPEGKVITEVIVKAGSEQSGGGCFALTPAQPTNFCFTAEFSDEGRTVVVEGGCPGAGISHLLVFWGDAPPEPDLDITGTCDWSDETQTSYIYTYTVTYTNLPTDTVLTDSDGNTYTKTGDGTFDITSTSSSMGISGGGASAGPYAPDDCPVDTKDLTLEADSCAINGSAYEYTYTATFTDFVIGTVITTSGIITSSMGCDFTPGESTCTTTAATGTVTFTDSINASVSADNGKSDTASGEEVPCPEPSLSIEGTSCVNDLNTLETGLYNYTVTFENLLTGTTINYDGGTYSVTTTSGSFDIIESTLSSITATWSADDSVTDSYDFAEGPECRKPTLEIVGDNCEWDEEGEWGDLLYHFTVTYSGFLEGEEIVYPNGSEVVGETGAGEFGFWHTSWQAEVSVVGYGAVSAEVNTDICPTLEPDIDIEGTCEINEGSDGYVYTFTVTYSNITPGTMIEDSEGGTHLVGATGEGSFEFTSDSTTGSAWWDEDEAIEDEYTIDTTTCPILDLTLEPIACALDQEVGLLIITWQVTNPGVHDVPYSWYTTPGPEAGIGIVAAGGTDVFYTNALTTESATIEWSTIPLPPADVAETTVIIDETGLRTVTVLADVECPDVLSLALLDPFCSLSDPEDEHSWQMTWTVQNPNTWDAEIYYQVNGGEQVGPITVPANSTMGLVNTPLGTHTVKVIWNGGHESITATKGLWINICENWPYNPPDYPDYPIIPVTGGELEAPAAGGELLIPVTGADMSAPLVSTGFFTNLYTNLGLFFLGLGLVLQGVKARITK